MAAPKSAVAKATAELQAQAQELDNRRQMQIRNQVASLNRVMQGGSYDDEMATLHEELADTQVRLEDALQELRRIKESGEYNLGGG